MKLKAFEKFSAGYKRPETYIHQHNSSRRPEGVGIRTAPVPHRSFFACCFVGLLLATCSPLAAQKDWKLSSEKDDIQVFFRETEDSPIKELKIKARMEGTISAAAALMSDVAGFPDWLDQCTEARILSKRSPSDYIYYQLIDFPWPFADREFVMHCRVQQDPVSLAVFFRSSAVPDACPLVKGNFRVQKTESQWKMEPDTAGYIRVEYHLKIDPGDALPPWVVNLALEKGPVKTVRSMRDTLKKGQYANKRPSFITEPLTK